MLEELKEWYEAERSTLAKKGWSLSLSAVLGAKVKVRYIDLDVPGVAARVTVWETGHCDLEAIASETGRRLFWEHRELERPGDLQREMDAFVGEVGSNAA